MDKLIVYTYLNTDYDWLLPPIWSSTQVQYICFTDEPGLKCEGWDVRYLSSFAGLCGGKMGNRYCKFFPWNLLPSHDWSIYIDANIRLLKDPTAIMNQITSRGVEMGIFQHPDRNNVWQEADACKMLGKISTDEYPVLERQLLRYHNEGLPFQSGLTENGVIIRAGRSDRLGSVMKLWWAELNNGVKRDQISLPYVLWKTQTSIYRIPGSFRKNNPYFRIVAHRKKGDVITYLNARRYHGVLWSALYFGYWLVCGVKRRFIRLIKE
jgi:hypothetical protein